MMPFVKHFITVFGVASMSLGALQANAGTVRAFAAPTGEELSKDYAVKVEGTEVPVYIAKVAPADPGRRQAHPFTAELAPAGVSSRRGLPSRLGPTTRLRAPQSYSTALKGPHGPSRFRAPPAPKASPVWTPWRGTLATASESHLLRHRGGVFAAEVNRDRNARPQAQSGCLHPALVRTKNRTMKIQPHHFCFQPCSPGWLSRPT